MSKLVCQICGFENEKSILSHVRNEHGMTASEYREKYKSPLRVAWEKDKDFFKRLGKSNSEKMKGKKSRAALKNGKWSRHYDQCVECGSSKHKHISNGVCKRCYTNAQQKEIIAKKNEKIFEDLIKSLDFVIVKKDTTQKHNNLFILKKNIKVE